MQFRPWWVAFSVALSLTVLVTAARAEASGAEDFSAGVESYREFILDNGLRVVIAVDRRVPQVAVHLEYSVGDTLDPPEQRGLARLIGALLPELETRHVHAPERHRLLQAAGLRIDAPKVQVSIDATSLTVQVSPDALGLALWLEADRMGFAADGVTESALQRARPGVVSELTKSPADPNAMTAFRVGLGAGHPYGALLRAATLEPLHAKAVAARLRRYYNPASAVLVLVGDVDVARAEQAVRRAFGPLPAARLTPVPAHSASAAPRLLSMVAPIEGQFSALVWETPRYFEPDDAGLDVVAKLLERRLAAQKLCKSVIVGQRSRQLASVFVASCAGPVASSDAWRSAVAAELAALAEGRASAAEVTGAALFYARIMGQRADDLLGRAQHIASSVRTGHGGQSLPRLLERYATLDVPQIAAIVRRNLQKPPNGRLEVTPLQSAPVAGVASAGDTEPGFRMAPEVSASLSKDTSDWLRPPANDPLPRYELPTGLTEQLSSGDRFRFLERGGVPVAFARVQVPWPAAAFNAAARSVLTALVKAAPTPGGSLEESLRSLGTDLWIDDSSQMLELTLTAPPTALAASLELLGGVLASKQLSEAGFAAAKEAQTPSWVDAKPEDWHFYWDALGLSAPNSRYRYLSHSAREHLAVQLKFSDVDQLWRGVIGQPRAIDLVGPVEPEAARTLAALVTRKAGAPRALAQRAPARGPFRPGVYVLDNEGDTVEGCVLWPVPPWATPGHFPAHLLPYLFRTDTNDGFGARLAEHKAPIPYWQSNTVLTPDGDFERYSFRVPVDQVGPLLESVKAHLARLSNDEIPAIDFTTAIIDERDYQLQQALAGRTLLNSLGRAGYHDTDTNDALMVPLGVERVTRKQLAELVKGLTLGRATIGLAGPAARLTQVLSSLDLKPTSVTKADTPVALHGGSAP